MIKKSRKYEWVLRAANEFYGFDISKRCRQRNYVYARRMVMAFIKEFDTTSQWIQIGGLFNVDHSTVIHNVRIHESDVELAKTMIAYQPYLTEYIRLKDYLYKADPFAETKPLFSPENLKGYEWWI